MFWLHSQKLLPTIPDSWKKDEKSVLAQELAEVAADSAPDAVDLPVGRLGKGGQHRVHRGDSQ